MNKSLVGKAVLLAIFVSCLLTVSGQKAGRETKSSSVAGQSITTIPFELYSDLIYLPVRVNGSKPLWFVLDSGASACVVDQTVAKNLGLKTEGSSTGTGAGKCKYTLTFARHCRLP